MGGRFLRHFLNLPKVILNNFKWVKWGLDRIFSRLGKGFRRNSRELLRRQNWNKAQEGLTPRN